MVGMGLPAANRWRCSSGPVIPGVCTSAIRQDVRGTLRDFKNSSADENASAVNPNDFMSPLIASRIDSSSSTTEIRVLLSALDLRILASRSLGTGNPRRFGGISDVSEKAHPAVPGLVNM